MAAGQHAAGRRHPRHSGEAGFGCAPRQFVSRGAGRPPSTAVDVDLHDVGELTPRSRPGRAGTPGSVSRLTGIAHLRGHETDRLAALSAEINGLGGQCEEADGLVVTARRCTAAGGGPTPTTGWRRPAPSSGCGCPASRWTTSAPRPRRSPTSRRWAECSQASDPWIPRRGLRRSEYDESDVRVRPGRATGPQQDAAPSTPTPRRPWWSPSTAAAGPARSTATPDRASSRCGPGSWAAPRWSSATTSGSSAT